MTVQELIRRLEGCDPDAEVLLAYDYGDRSNTQVAQRVDRADEDTVVWSEYHRRWKVLDVADEPDEDDRTKDAVVLS